MTARNLATIFGPNLLHMQKNSDKEFEVQSLALANDRMAIIAVVLSMITNYRTLFMVRFSGTLLFIGYFSILVRLYINVQVIDKPLSLTRDHRCKLAIQLSLV